MRNLAEFGLVKSKCVVCEDGHCVISSFRLSVQQR